MAESSATSLFGAWFAKGALTQVIEGRKHAAFGSISETPDVTVKSSQ